MKRVIVLAVAGFALAGCGEGEDMRSVGQALVSCESDQLRIAFDPTTSVEVASGNRTLAAATFTERRLNADCRDAPGTDVRSDDRLDQKGIDGRAELECRLRNGLHIRVNPIFNADIGRNDGSALVVLDGDFVVAAAILKNKGDPRASRIYRAQRSCTDA
jgi:predicted small secreted protein